MNAPKNSSFTLAFSVMSGVILTILLLQSRYLWVRAFHYDEGHWLMFGVLTNAGYPAYTTTFVGIPPFALWAIQLGHALFGTTLGARYPMVLLSLVGVASLFWLLQPHQSRFNLVAALLASFMLAFNTLYFIENASLMAEIPAIAWALLSLLLAQTGTHKSEKTKNTPKQIDFAPFVFFVPSRSIFVCSWLFLSGIAFGLSLALKLFVIFIPFLIMGELANKRINEKPTANVFIRLLRLCFASSRSLLIWLTGVAFPWLIFGLIYPPFALYHETVAFRLALRQATLAQGEGSLSENITMFTAYLAANGVWLGLAMMGAALAWRHRRPQFTLWLAWLALATALLLYHVPLRGRYILLLTPPLAVLASFSLTYTLQWLFHALQRHASRRQAEFVIMGLLTMLMVWGLVWPFQQARRPLFTDPHGYIYGNVSAPEQAIIDLARQYTLPQDCLIVDDQRVAMAVPRLVPPFLSETSSARHLTQFITTSTIMEQINRYDCSLVIYWDGRFMKYLPDLAAQLRDHYFLEITYNDHLVVYLAQKHAILPPDSAGTKRGTELKVDFGDTLHLQGFTLPSEPWQPGQTIPLATYWQATAHPAIGYKFLLQLTPLSSPLTQGGQRGVDLTQGGQEGVIELNFDQFPLNPPSADYQFKRGPYYLLPTLDLAALPQAQLADYPARGMLPTNAWPLNQTLRIVSPFNLPPDLPPGRYQLYLGLYDPDTLARLPVSTPQGQTDKLLLLTIAIK